MKRVATIATVCIVNSFLSAATGSIGSAISHGDLRIDNYPVKVSGTIFDGSDVETGMGSISSADVRLNGNSTLTLYSDSRGQFYRDRFVLLRGQVEVAAPSAFHTEATGLVISANEPQTNGLISLGTDGVVHVSAQAGAFRVDNSSGSVLARVSAQNPLSFARQEDGTWQTRSGSNWDFDRDRDRCYVGDRDDRDCDHHHHHHPSK
jgi:hypothetical protein